MRRARESYSACPHTQSYVFVRTTEVHAEMQLLFLPFSVWTCCLTRVPLREHTMAASTGLIAPNEESGLIRKEKEAARQSCTNPSFGCLLFIAFCIVCLTAWIGALLFWLAESSNERSEAGLDEVLEIEAGLDIDVNGTEEEVVSPVMPYNATEELVALRELYEQLKLECIQGPPSEDDLKWTMAGSLFFALQVMFTIGYGTFAPVTTAGRSAVIFFGLFGIIVSSFFIGTLVAAFDRFLKQQYESWFLRTGESVRVGETMVHNYGYQVLFKVCATASLLLLYSTVFALLCTLDYSLLSGDWEAKGKEVSYIAEVARGIYFFFVSVSSIGFGDVTMKYDNVGFVLLQYFLYIPGMMLFTEFASIGIDAARHMAGAKDLIVNVYD